MLDKKVDAVLSYFNENVGENFVVLDKTDVISALPEKLEIDTEVLESAINFLESSEYIIIKYQDEYEVCLATTNNTQAYFEYNKKRVDRAVLGKKTHLAVFAFGFLGAFLGSALALILFKLFGGF